LKIQPGKGGTNDNLEGDHFGSGEDWLNEPKPPSLSTLDAGRSDLSISSGKLDGSLTVETGVGRRVATLSNDNIYEVSFPRRAFFSGP
jgi:hypothetical protein